MKKNTFLIVLSYASVYIVWGTTYFFIRMSVETMPPLFVLTFRWFIGGLFFIIYALFTDPEASRSTKKEIINSLWLGLLLLFVSNGLVTLAEKKIDSYIAALVLSITPLGVAFFDRVLWKKRISLISVFAMVVGFSGVGLLLYDFRSISGNLHAGILMILVAVASWSLGTSLGHRVLVPKSGILNSGIQMFGVGVCSFVLMLTLFPVNSHTLTIFSMRSWLGVGYLTVFGALAFAGYTYLIKHEPAIRIVSYCFVNPVIAVLIGLLAGNEKAVSFLGMGIAMIFIGLFFTLYGDNILLRKRNIK